MWEKYTLMKTALLVADRGSQWLGHAKALVDEGFSLSVVTTEKEALEHCSMETPEKIIAFKEVGGGKGLSVLLTMRDKLKGFTPSSLLVLVTNWSEEKNMEGSSALVDLGISFTTPLPA